MNLCAKIQDATGTAMVEECVITGDAVALLDIPVFNFRFFWSFIKITYRNVVYCK